ncbi:metal ion binding [Chlorella sorokiniana]|uniref:Metal ion binding n=1 Tax=Chlorella sorokiniana TaxID=3076 RepID=A0A2P6TRV0_CHLSO|nr:metal ion binding [Chlorella sorokiniana]|eukprot:PRW56782.1 metal ion binding [Chlorella sorokiniana]
MAPPPDGPRGRPPGEPGRPAGRRPTFEEKVASDVKYCRQRFELLQQRYKRRQELLGQLEASKEEKAAKYASQYAAELEGQAVGQGGGKQQERQKQQQQQQGAG